MSSQNTKTAALCELFEQLLVTLFVLTMIFTYCVRIVSVKGDSMKNTLMSDDKVVISMLHGKLKCGDIAVMRTSQAVTLDEDNTLILSEGLNINIIKRIIACEGQTVDIDFSSGNVTVDGERLSEPYLQTGLTHNDEGAFTGKYPLTVPEGYVFVMGDNRSCSKDSRSDEIGFIPVDDIAGKVIFRIYPNFKFIE